MTFSQEFSKIQEPLVPYPYPILQPPPALVWSVLVGWYIFLYDNWSVVCSKECRYWIFMNEYTYRGDQGITVERYQLRPPPHTGLNIFQHFPTIWKIKDNGGFVACRGRGEGASLSTFLNWWRYCSQYTNEKWYSTCSIFIRLPGSFCRVGIFSRRLLEEPNSLLKQPSKDLGKANWWSWTVWILDGHYIGNKIILSQTCLKLKSGEGPVLV